MNGRAMEIHIDTTCIVMNSVEKLSVWGLGQGGGDGGVAWEGRKSFVYFVCYSRRQQLLNNKQSPTGVKENVTVFNYITKRA